MLWRRTGILFRQWNGIWNQKHAQKKEDQGLGNCVKYSRRGIAAAALLIVTLSVNRLILNTAQDTLGNSGSSDYSDDYGDYYDDSDDYEPSADDPYYKEIRGYHRSGCVLYHRLDD